MRRPLDSGALFTRECRVVEESKLGKALQSFCSMDFGVVKNEFLCQPVSALGLDSPVCVHEGTSIADVMRSLQSHRTGAVLVTNETEVLTGIFTERDFVLKVYGQEGVDSKPVSEFMTKDPVVETPAVTLAFVLNLMSHGGFRHVPIVDEEKKPISVIGVKNVVDFIVERMTQDLLDIPLEE